MKLFHLPTVCAALLALCPTFASAQTSAVPGFISYQGRVVDAAGANVGAGTPVNRTVIFRIWDNPSSTNAANLIYSESQTVTVSEGEFSVLVGQGVANLTQTFGYSEAGADKKLADFSTAFTGSARYLGVTVAAAATIATTDNEITPRQQIVSTAFAMRAKFAESIGSSSDLALTPLSGIASNYGLGWYGTGRTFNNVAVDGPVLYGNSGGALGSSNGAGGAKNLALAWNASGNVGIGTTTPENALTLQRTIGSSNVVVYQHNMQLEIRNGIGAKSMGIGVMDDGRGVVQVKEKNNGAGYADLLLNPIAGNVGINSGSPSANLTIRSGKNGWPNTSGTAFAPSATGFRLFGADNAMLDAGVYSSLGAWLQATDQVNMALPYPLILNPNGGNVGIGTTSPGAKLDVAGDIKSSGKMVPVGEESLRIVRGNIDANGAPIAGSGWTVVRGSSGYTVTFSTPFSGQPSVTFGCWTDYSPYLYALSASSFSVAFNIPRQAGNLPSGFSFMAVGPR